MKNILYLIVPISLLAAVILLSVLLWSRGNSNLASIDAKRIGLNGGLSAGEVEQLIN